MDFNLEIEGKRIPFLISSSVIYDARLQNTRKGTIYAYRQTKFIYNVHKYHTKKGCNTIQQLLGACHQRYALPQKEGLLDRLYILKNVNIN
jgi:hypothetical protein